MDEALEGFKTVESGLNRQLKEERFWADGLAKEVEKLKSDLATKENLSKKAIIVDYKESDEYDMGFTQAGAPDVQRAWVVAERHVKTDPGVNWESFIQEFLAAKAVIEQGKGEP